MAAPWLTLLGVVLCFVSSSFGKVTSPPEILVQPNQIEFFKIGESIELPCDARGEPRPEFSWEKDGIKLEVSSNDNRFTQQPDKGTIIINDPLKKDEGVYQCFAKNDHGRAVAQKVILKSSVLSGFTPVEKPQVHVVSVGDSLKLPCTKPTSFPEAEIYWTITSPTGSWSKQLPLTNRVTMDAYGTLYITNVKKRDQDGGTGTGEMVIYQCTAYNRVERSEVKGDDQKISVSGSTSARAPEFMWSTVDTAPTARRGEKFVLKCIFGGDPTPKVSWEKTDGQMGPGARLDSYGQELVFDDMKYTDAGKYECAGLNDHAANPSTKAFTVSVDSKPVWTQKPQNLERAEGEDATFHCAAEARPTANIDWFINGYRIINVPDPKRSMVNPNTILFKNLALTDSQVLQCNASNANGWVFANAYLNVLSIPPEFEKPPQKLARFAEGTRRNVTCLTHAAPKAQITWIKDGYHLTGGRYKVYPDGNLEITEVKSADAGTYKCIAKNKMGTISATGTIIVRQPTTIVQGPQDMIINAGDEAKFVCTATTDPEELSGLSIKWLRDGDPINYALSQRIFKNTLDNSLTITNAQKTDTGVYACVAHTPLDEVQAFAVLTVRDRPNAPTNVHVDCNDRKAEKVAIIKFDPNGANYAPFLEFIVQYNTTFTPDVWSVANKSDANKKQVEFHMSPGAIYSFRVLARNRLGLSDPSAVTKQRCETQKDVPYTNPKNVEIESTKPDNLVIKWTPMPAVEFNAPGFVYTLEWTCLNDECKNNRLYSGTATIAETWRKEYIIKDQLTYMKYAIQVGCKNQEGTSKVDPKEVIGYSGEGIPADKPEGFTVDNAAIGATDALFQWKAVRNDTKLIKGFFVGYLIQFWKESEGAVRMQQVIIDMNNMEVASTNLRRKKRAASQVITSGDAVIAKVTELPAYSKIEAQVSVVNKKYQGQPSARITFKTGEGTPGPVNQFIIFRRNSNMLEFLWDPPLEPNGIITGYDIAYRSVNTLDLGDRSWRAPITDPTARRANISGLRPEQMYRVYIYAKTVKGRGEENYVDASTTAARPPSPPTFIIPEVNSTSMNVTWTPSKSGNPGSVFYVQYRKDGKFQWETTAVEYVNNYINVTGLSPGTVYEVRVVSRNGQNQEAASGSQFITTKGYSATLASVASEPWFILMFICILILIILFIVICYLRKKLPARYADAGEEEHEKEKLRHDIQPHQPRYRDDPRYHHREYVSNAAYEKSQDSLHKEPIPDDDDHHYRREPYGGHDNGRYHYDDDDRVTEPMQPYHEDGSYVGQYGVQPAEKTIHGPPDSSTFV